MICVLPYGTDRPASRFPAVTWALIAANVLIYIWSRRVGPDIVISGMGLVPDYPSISNVVTSMFIHADLLHLAWNLIFLYLFGPNVEEALGRVAYAIFYFGSGFAAALLHVVVAQEFSPDAATIPYIGASGAIAGILGIYAIRYYKTRLRIWFVFFSAGIPAWIALGVWFAQQLYGGLNGILSPGEGGVAYWSHIGGMAFGMLLAYALRMGRQCTREYLMADACASLEQGATWSAAECLLSLLKSDPENADVHRELGTTYAMQHNHDQSIRHFRMSVELFLRMECLEKAVEAYGRMRQYYPNARINLASEFRLARYLVDTGVYGPALVLLESITLHHADTRECETALVKIGDIHLNALGDPKAAAVWYERCLHEFPASEYRALVEKNLATARARLAVAGE